jgi:Zn-dependent peptidase ImmA (M78 family)
VGEVFYLGGLSMVVTPKSPLQLETLAEFKLEQHGFDTVPVNPVTIAEGEGIRVFNADFASEDVSGLIRKNKDEIAIYVKNSEMRTRKRFTVAHELGHLFLHLTDQDGNFVDGDVQLFRGVERSWKETEANQYAAALLMPRKWVVKHRASGYTTEELAELFDVSPSAMEFRLGHLGLLNG